MRVKKIRLEEEGHKKIRCFVKDYEIAIFDLNKEMERWNG